MDAGDMKERMQKRIAELEAALVARIDAVDEKRIARLEAMLRAAGYSDEQIKAGTPYIEVMGG